MIRLTIDDLEEVRRGLLRDHRPGYYGWLRQIVTLSFGSLTFLVLLQKNYIPENPQYLWLLLVSWGLLALSVLSGVLALSGEFQIHLDAEHYLGKVVSQLRKGGHLDSPIPTILEPRPIFQISNRLTISCFLSALLFLTLFASININNLILN